MEREIHEELLWVPDGLNEDDPKVIREEVLAETRHITNNLTVKELQNEGARRAYTVGALATVRQMVNLKLAQNYKEN